jgi:hypothetical protein
MSEYKKQLLRHFRSRWPPRRNDTQLDDVVYLLAPRYPAMAFFISGYIHVVSFPQTISVGEGS